MCPTDIELQRESIKELEKHIERLQATKEKMKTELDKLNVYRFFLQSTKKAPELLARIETHIGEGRQHCIVLTEKIERSKSLYQRLQFFSQINDPLHARFERSPESPGPSSPR